MNTATVRSNLERTGVLFTQHEDDRGHIPDFWRATILALCDALDAAPTNAADLLRQERLAHAASRDELAHAYDEAAEAREREALAVAARERAEDNRRVAVALVADAVPRMRTLNNAMSAGWLERANKLLEG